MGNSNRLILAAALGGLFLAGCTETGTSREPPYHITCWSGNISIYEGDISNVSWVGGAFGFEDEDGQKVEVTGNCVLEQNIDRSKTK